MPKKPLPTKLKILKGTAQQCRINKKEPKPKSDRVKMPSGLSLEAKKCWRSVSKELSAAGVLTNMDVHALSLYCEAYARWIDANRQIEKYGTVIKAPSGYPVQSPYLAISNKAFDQMRAMLVEFGMTPSSRTKVSTTNVDTDDPLADFINAGKNR